MGRRKYEMGMLKKGKKKRISTDILWKLS